MQISKESIQALLLRKDQVGMKAVGRALLVLHANQTMHEQQVQATTNRNHIGFTQSDARRGSGMAEFYKKKGFLTPKQLEYWQNPARTEAKRIRITKYWGQLLEAAQRKQAKNMAEQLQLAA
jgi:hypothetical protein